MFCKQCGAELQNGTQFCQACGASQGGQAPSGYGGGYGGGYSGGGKIESYLVPNIIATLLCCLPLGIIGIIYSSGANSAASRGDWATAEQKASTAKTLFWVSFCIGLVAIIAQVAIAVSQQGIAN